MANLKSIFVQAINGGMAAAKGIPDAEKRALAYASLAQAMALTGGITIAVDSDFEDGAAAAPAKGKESLKPETAKATKPSTAKAPAPKAEAAPEPEPVLEPELSEEWNDEMVELKADQIAYIQTLREQFEPDQLNETVSQFSEGVMKTMDEISPLNIDAFVGFVQGLLASE